MKNSNLLKLPFSLTAENAVIGTILSFPSVVVDTQLKEDDFYHPTNKMVFKAINCLIAESKPPEPVLVFEKIKELGYESKIDFSELINFLSFGTSYNYLSHWSTELKKYWKLREIVAMCSEVYEKSLVVAEADIDEFLNYSESRFVQMSSMNNKKTLTSEGPILEQALKELENSLVNKEKRGITTGFHNLDKITAGFQPSDLIILAARPAMGKTSFALNIAYHVAHELKKTVAFFSCEMSSVQLMQKLLCTAAKISPTKLRSGNLTQQELGAIYPVAGKFLTNNRLFIDDTASIGIYDLSSKARKLKRDQGGLDLIIVDYLQLMVVGEGGDSKNIQNREREISVISMGLKALAKELNCPVIALSQLNRNLESRPDKRPKPSDLRESGSIEQDSDQILMVYRDEVYYPESPDKGIAEVIIGKNRHGPTDTVKLAFKSEFATFKNIYEYHLTPEDISRSA